jgi:hypothetical protein
MQHAISSGWRQTKRKWHAGVIVQQSVPATKLPGTKSERGIATARAGKIALGLLLVVAALLRISVTLLHHNLIWPDEIFQVVEPAHRLVFGNGLVAWEWVVGMRSWIFPGVIAGVLWIEHFFVSGPPFETIAIQLFMIACSLLPVAVAYKWGERLDGVRGGVIVGGFLAVWVDLIYIAPHPLSDVISSDVLMAGLYVALPLTTRPGFSRLVVAGALFGLTLALRMQMAPGLLAAAICACGLRPKDWIAITLGGAIVLLFSGILDWLTLGTPFQSIWLNFWLNVVKGVSSDIGTAPAAFFFVYPLLLWGVASALIIAQIMIGGRRFPALLVVALTIFASQSLFAHKEWRFIFPALPPLITLCGIAAIKEARDLEAFTSRYISSRHVPDILLLGIWLVLSLLVGAGPYYRSLWTFGNETVDAFAYISQQPHVCGVDVAGIRWIATPGSAALPPDTPIYANHFTSILHDAPAYNVALADVTYRIPGSLYRRAACFAGSFSSDGQPTHVDCVWVRAGGCIAGIAAIPTPIWPGYFLNKDGTPRQDRIQMYQRRPL